MKLFGRSLSSRVIAALGCLVFAGGSAAALQQPTYIKSIAPHSPEIFGCALAHEDDLLVVGARGNTQDPAGNYSPVGFFRSGAIFFFAWTGSEWTEAGWRKSPSYNVDGMFGYALALEAGRLFVSAPGELVDPNDAGDPLAPVGVVHVFENSGGTWSPTARLSASNASAEDRFGYTLAAHEDRLVVGATGERSESNVINQSETDNTSLFVGAAYVFERTASGWIQDAYLKASNSGQSDRFGASVSVYGNLVVVGAPFESSSLAGIGSSVFNNHSIWSGAAYLFRKTTAGWIEEAYVKAAYPDSNERFGSASLAISEDEFFLSATEERGNSAGVNGDQDTNGPESGGAVYQFERGSSGWEQTNYFKSPWPVSREYFGGSLSFEEGRLLVSGPGSSLGGEGLGIDPLAPGISSSGAASSFFQIRDRWVVAQYLKASNPDFLDSFGWPVLIANGQAIVSATRERSASPGIDGDQTDNSILSGNTTDYAGAVYAFRSGVFTAGAAYCEATATCASCPCGNEPAPAATGGCANSRGLDAHLTGLGSEHLPEDTLRFASVDGSTDALHILVSGANALPQAGGACPRGSGISDPLLDGLRCVGGNLLRHGARISDSNGDVGVTTDGWGRIDRSAPVSLAAGQIAGQTRYFQVFYRDLPLAGCSAQINTTNAVAITFR